jgi:quercetin dioxygenase-like cupin family protein
MKNTPPRAAAFACRSSEGVTMEWKVFNEVERFSKEKHVHVPLFTSERTKVLLLCLAAGLTVPPHSHPGFDITLQPLKGKAILPIAGGEDVLLVPGVIFFVDGAMSFNPRNPFGEDFEMLIHLIGR